MESFSGTYGIDLTAVRRQWHVWNVKIFLMVLMSRPNIQWHTWNYRIIQWHTRNCLYIFLSHPINDMVIDLTAADIIYSMAVWLKKDGWNKIDQGRIMVVWMSG